MAAVAKQLVRATIRAFYTDEHVAVTEALLREPFYLYDDQQKTDGSLSHAFGGLPYTKIRKILEHLRADSLVDTQSVENKLYWFVHFPHFIKVVRLRVSMLSVIANQNARAGNSVGTDLNTAKGLWRCPECDERSSMLEALTHKDPVTFAFLCRECDAVLVESKTVVQKNVVAAKKDAQALVRRIRTQTHARPGLHDGIVELIEKCDHVALYVPENVPFAALSQEKLAKEKDAQIKSDLALHEGSALHSRDSKLYAGKAGQKLQVSFGGTVEDDQGVAAVDAPVAPSWITQARDGSLTEVATKQLDERASKKMRLESEAARKKRATEDRRENERDDLEAYLAANRSATTADVATVVKTVEDDDEELFTFRGVEYALGDVTPEMQASMTTNEYASFVEFQESAEIE